MPRISSPSDHYLEIEVLDYAYSANGDVYIGDYDANWLTIHMAAKDSSREWSATHAALLTWEIHRLVCWLRSLVNGDQKYKDYFIAFELNLQLEVNRQDNPGTIIATFGAEFLPSDISDGEQRYELRIASDEGEIVRFASELQATCRSFPIRFVEKDGPATFYASSLGIAPPERSNGELSAGVDYVPGT